MIVLHHCPETRSMRVLWLLHELGVPFAVVVYPFDRALRAPDYLAISPAGRVPALQIDGLTLFESGAILEYLCERFPDAGLGRAPGHPERAEWLVWVHFAETISQHSAALTQAHIVLREEWMRSPTVMRLEARRLEKCFAALAGRLAGRAWLLDGGFSAADVAVGQAVSMARHFAPLAAFAALAAWWGRIVAREGFARALPGPGEARLFTQDFYAPPATGHEK